MTDPTPRAVSLGKQSELERDSFRLASTRWLESIPLPILVLDAEGRVCQVNQAAKAVWEVAEGSQGLGVGFALRCVHFCEQPNGCGGSPSCASCSVRQIVARTRDTGQAQHQVEVRMVMRRGPKSREFYSLVSTGVLDSPQGRRFLVCLEDITAHKQAELEVRRALQEVAQLKKQLQLENSLLKAQLTEMCDSEQIVGKSEKLKLTLEKARRAAATDANVLITGETGSGKGLIARMIHNQSSRKKGPLITVNCAALSLNLIESELFGHCAGAFTGALRDKAGRFEIAHGGTIFLDEIGELPLEAQAKLLRVVQHGRLERVGSSDTRAVDVRILAATNCNLQEQMAARTFRSDLYYRLAVFPIEVPPLRDRREDIPLLVWHIVTKTQVTLGKKIERIPKAVMDALIQYDWPGNIRELENVIERSVILSPGPTLLLHDRLTRSVKPRKLTASEQDMKSVERSHILDVLEECHWRVNGEGNAAARLDMKPSTLRSRMKKLGIERPPRRPR